MCFVPLRKLLKILFVRNVSSKRERIPLSFHECLDAAPESRRKCSKRWLILLTCILLCLLIIVFHTTAYNKLFVRQNTMNKEVTTDNLEKYHAVKKNDPTLDISNGLVGDILKNIDEDVKENNITIKTTTSKAVYQNTDQIKYDMDFTSVPTTNIFLDEVLNKSNEDYKELSYCGPFEDNNENDEFKKVQRRLAYNLFPDVKMGGYYTPKKCRSRYKVAILVPYRNRERNLAVFVYYMHTFLMKQELEYRIFIIEQAGGELFNRGKLLNIGFTEMMKYNDWHCVVLHDVDLLPLSKEILYACPVYPRHLVGTVFEKSNLMYGQYRNFFGGASILSVQHYKLMNGFSNLYWGWGGEDKDMYWRIISAKLQIVRNGKSIARYTSLPHAKSPRNTYRFQLLKFAVARHKTDGLSSLVYKVIWTKHRHLYTHILADVNPLRENITEVYRKMFHSLT